MNPPTLRRAFAPCLLAGAVALAGCGDPASDQAVRAGSPGQDPIPGASSTLPADPDSTGSTTSPAPTTSTVVPDTTEAPPASTSTPVPTTVAVGTDGDPSPSAVGGLSPEEVKEAALAPATATARRARGPVLETITLPTGQPVWRVRIPGNFPARSARVTVLVGERTVGTGIVTPGLDALLAITTDGSGLTAGAPVSYRWDGGTAVAAGTLAVTR